jgi:hypothetical protein
MILAAGGVVGVAQSAQAAVPDRFGFALYSGGGLSEQWPDATTVTVLSPPGRWAVTFPGQGIDGGVVHVTGIHDPAGNPPGRWCQADDWTPTSNGDEVVNVSCHKPGGQLDPAPGFSVTFSHSSGISIPGLYGYIDSSATGAINDQYNSVGVANSVTRTSAGKYTVTFPKLGTPSPYGGGVQVTAVNPDDGARCKVADWFSTPALQELQVQCFDPTGVQSDTRFTVTFQFERSLYGQGPPLKRFGYLWNEPPPGPPATNFNGSGGPNTLTGGPFEWQVTFPNIALSPGNAQVTAFGQSSDFCSLLIPWFTTPGSSLMAVVDCFTNAGDPSTTSGFFASYSALV